jgi:hypothetical protein
MLDDLKEKYLDDVKTMLPLHRLFIFALGCLYSLVQECQAYKSFGESLVNIELSSISFETGGLLENALISNVLAGLVLCILTWCMNSIFLQLFFKWVMQKIDAKKKIRTQLEKIKSLWAENGQPPYERLSYFAGLSTAASKRVSRLANLGEMALGVSLCFFIASYRGNSLDIVVALLFLVIFGFSTYSSTFSFFSKYLKYDLITQAISGDQRHAEFFDRPA